MPAVSYSKRLAGFYIFIAMNGSSKNSSGTENCGLVRRSRRGFRNSPGSGTAERSSVTADASSTSIRLAPDIGRLRRLQPTEREKAKHTRGRIVCHSEGKPLQAEWYRGGLNRPVVSENLQETAGFLSFPWGFTNQSNTHSGGHYHDND